MTWTTTDLDAIETALKSGTSRVRYADREVTYRSVDEMIRLRDLIREALGLIPQGGRSHHNLSHSKGLDSCGS